ncbi:unnamed protein product (macronuclear) [Paramecium tetraurelia]|uniref:Uncharacterized protein n=1 Tax=Paramecium tetraurelia TaxID=5888 RepID=A0D015_PARTE|nr:uncharacterized protein GSPATT00039130001 [Paramecium tetraurelia]CAK76382.1 unnamed protein product [Paramecium tetraurelia]|eukprot:XP_001443779.1 hypothetical protein (macronuclear) [Paramecium tetraurelia strain d4-2]
MNEQQNNFVNTSCNIIQQIFDIQLQKAIKSTQISEINFENESKRFNLGHLEFNMDPFEQDDKIQEIVINCKTNYNDEKLSHFSANWGNFTFPQVAKNVNQNKVFIQSHIMQQNVQFLIQINFKQYHQITFYQKQAIGDHITLLIMQNYATKTHIFVKEVGLLMINYVLRDIQEDFVKNVIDLIQEGMDNSLKISNQQNVNNVKGLRNGCQHFLLFQYGISNLIK